MGQGGGVSTSPLLSSHTRNAHRLTCRVGLVRRRFIQHFEPQIISLSIRARHFDESVNLPHGWNVVWDEALDFGVELDVVRFVAADVPEQLADLR